MAFNAPNDQPTDDRAMGLADWWLGMGRLPASAKLGVTFVVFVVIGVVFAPLFTSADPVALGPESLMPPSAAHLMGTDDLGRDVLARVLYGGRVSLVVGLFSALLAMVFGISIGMAAGHFGGAVDEILMRITEVFQILPRLLVAIVVVALLGGGVANVILVIGILSWPATARIIRTNVMVIKNEEFMSAATMSGASHLRLILRHAFPNVLPYFAVSASLQVATAILTEAALSFLGLGDPTYPSWGLMLQQGQLYLAEAWWVTTFPGLAISITVLGLNLVGDGLGRRVSGGRP